MTMFRNVGQDGILRLVANQPANVSPHPTKVATP
jgi:hypothetical protein